MRKYMIVLPCLLFSGLVAAEDAHRPKQQKAVASASAAADKSTRLADPSNRFNMTQDGKKMTADDFDAWMKKNGYRVAAGPSTASADAGKKDKK